ncbi:MAG: TIGR00269 family protein [Promethearchaeota archaeon]
MKCNYCSKKAVKYRRYSGEYLCKNCFLKSIEKKVQKIISKYDMLCEDSRIAVGISGGKDSSALLYILDELEKRFPKAELIAVTVDEGIAGYRDESLKNATAVAKALGIEHVVVSFENLFGMKLDELAKTVKEDENSVSSCTHCGVLRRNALNQVAKMVDADRLATAHNLDDEAQTVLMNIIRSDTARIIRTAPLMNYQPEFVPRIKPIREIPEKETTLYAYYKDIPIPEVVCPYASEALRNDIRVFLNDMEEKHPEVKYNLLRAADQIRESLTPLVLEKTSQLDTCRVCGAPTNKRICKTCQLLQGIRRKLPSP